MMPGPYLWLKALHVAAVLAWTGGLVLLCVATVALRPATGVVLLPHEQRLYTGILGWERRVTRPTMLAVWALGLALAGVGGWWGAPWLHAKLAVVVGLSGLHGVLAGALRRRQEQPRHALPAWMAWAPALALAGMATVAVLVVLKP
jgi:uncharacterized membrane protein